MKKPVDLVQYMLANFAIIEGRVQAYKDSHGGKMPEIILVHEPDNTIVAGDNKLKNAVFTSTEFRGSELIKQAKRLVFGEGDCLILAETKGDFMRTSYSNMKLRTTFSGATFLSLNLA